MGISVKEIEAKIVSKQIGRGRDHIKANKNRQMTQPLWQDKEHALQNSLKCYRSDYAAFLAFRDEANYNQDYSSGCDGHIRLKIEYITGAAPVK